MRKFVVLIAILVTSLMAHPRIFLGAENQKRVYIGYEHNRTFGFFIKNTVFKQDLELQQVEINPYVHLNFSPTLSLGINPFFGTRYDSDFYYFGSRFSVDWFRFQYFQLKMELDPYYHSREKYATLYETQIRSFIFPSVGIVAGARNIPEYNQIDERAFGGLIIRDSHSEITTTITVPYHFDDSHLIRFNISFIHTIDL